MEIVRTISQENRRAFLKIKVSFSDREQQIIEKYGLHRYRIKTRDSAFIGRDVLPLNIQSAYRSHLARVKDRWSTALVRTTGFVIFDVFLIFLGIVAKFIKAILKIFFGRRYRLASAMKGITISARRVEKIKEADFFIFVSLAAIHRALEYAKSFDREDIYVDGEIMTQVEGLDFAGAGSQIEDELEAITTAMKHLEAANS